MEIYSLYQSQIIGTKIYLWILSLLIDWKDENYDSIFVIVDLLTKMVNYKLVKIIINVMDLAKIIIDNVIRYHGLSNSIITDQGSLFIPNSGPCFAIS